jgi:type II secretory pathway component PulF
MYNFSFTVALMLKNGIRLKDALTLSQKTINNIYIKNEIINITTLMVQGLTFSDAMSKQPHFDSILVNVILTGEESGQLSFSLSQIADYYNDELGRHIDKVSELAQPVSIILISIIIIPVVIAIYLPIFDLSSGALI